MILKVPGQSGFELTILPRYAPLTTALYYRTTCDALVSLRVMHNNDEVNENDDARLSDELSGKLRGSTSKESYNLMARFSGS